MPVRFYCLNRFGYFRTVGALPPISLTFIHDQYGIGGQPFMPVFARTVLRQFFMRNFYRIDIGNTVYVERSPLQILTFHQHAYHVQGLTATGLTCEQIQHNPSPYLN